MATKIAAMLDGGHVRVHARKSGKTFDPDYIEKIGHACVEAGEVIHSSAATNGSGSSRTGICSPCVSEF
jgi:hypothetical protein